MLYYKKKKITQTLKKLRNDYIACVYDGLIKNKTIREIHKEIRNITRVVNNKWVLNLEKTALKSFLSIKPKIYKSEDFTGLILADFVANIIDKEKIYNKTNEVIYNEVKKYEAEEKEEIIKNDLKSNRSEKSPKIFYICSSHNDCAKDHLDYQGKIYIDDKWEQIINDNVLKKEIRMYINVHNVKTLQYITYKPVWLITRPNCRHYFKAINTEEVLNKNSDAILRNHKLHSKIGQKTTQTLRHPTNKEWYKETNVKNIISKYEDRFEFHKSLWEKNKRVQLFKRAMEKDKFLIKKWKDYLQTFK